MYTSWSFAQIRNNFRILRDYKYLQLLCAKAGLADQYKLSGEYSDLQFLSTIQSLDQLKEKLTNNKLKSLT